MIAAVYCRKSTEQNGVSDDQKSVTRQIEHARAYAVRKGWTVDDAHVYVDDGISGAEFANRPGFLRLMNALKPRPPFQVLMMSEESRLGREADRDGVRAEAVVRRGRAVFFYLEDRESTARKPDGQDHARGGDGFAADLEREKARQRTYDAMCRKAKAGHVHGRAPVSATDNVDGHRRRRPARRTSSGSINEPEAAIIRRIFAVVRRRPRVKAIAKTLNAEGATVTRAQRGRSQSWAPSSVREVLFGMSTAA